MSELKDSRGSAAPLISESVITDGDWHRVGLVWDGSYRHLYAYGVEVAKDAGPLTVSNMLKARDSLTMPYWTPIAFSR